MAIRLNDPIRSKIADQISAYLSGTSGTKGTAGVLKVYNGTQPGTAGGTSGTSLLIVEISPISWSNASNGTAAISTNVTGTAGTDGTATWARLSDSSGTAYIIDGNCGTSAASDFVIDIAEITATSVVTLSAATLIQPGS